MAALTLCILPLLLSGFGCKAEHLESSGEDDAYLRLPNDKPLEIPVENGPLLVTTPGTEWIYAVNTEIRTTDMTEPVTPKASEERVIIAGQRAIGKVSGTVFKIDQNGKSFREEVMRLDEKGLSLVAAGISSGTAVDTMSITPGIPLVEFPLRDGAVVSWEGILRLTKNKIQAPGYAHSRLSAREIIELPLGKSGTMKKVGTYKIETMITTTVDSRPIYLYSARWFAPGMGMVRQLVISGRQYITKNLMSFKPAGKGAKVASAR